MFMNQKKQYSENEYTTQSNLQIQCNSYQANNGIFHRTRMNNFTIVNLRRTFKRKTGDLKLCKI